MFLEILLGILLGVFFGIITGLTPGIHINLVAALLLSVSPVLLFYTNVLVLCVFIISMSITHTFLDSIPSIFLGAPDSAQALGVLPGHRYLLKGLGLMAVKLTLIGSFGALILSVLLFFPLMPFVKFIYPILKNYIGFLLIAVVVFMLFREKKKFFGVLLFVFSGTLGLIVLNIPNLKNPLFALLSGLFGVSTLLYSLNESETIPKQKQRQDLKLDKWVTIKALFSGTVSGFITAVMPGLGAATAAVLSMQITKNLGDHGFMILIGGINTVNFVLSLVTLYVLGKARNGAVIVVQKLISDVSLAHILVFVFVSLIVGAVGVFLALKIGKWFCFLIGKVNYKKLIICIIILIVVLSFVLSGWLGLFILIVATAVGLIPAVTKVARVHAMGCLLLSVILYFVV